jgi:hypothetical protein
MEGWEVMVITEDQVSTREVDALYYSDWESEANARLDARKQARIALAHMSKLKRLAVYCRYWMELDNQGVAGILAYAQGKKTLSTQRASELCQMALGDAKWILAGARHSCVDIPSQARCGGCKGNWHHAAFATEHFKKHPPLSTKTWDAHE